MKQNILSNDTLGEYFVVARELCYIVHDSAEIIREETVSSLKQYFSPTQGKLIDRISLLSVDIFTGMCVLSRVFLAPVAILFVIRRSGPMIDFVQEIIRPEATTDSIAKVWKDITKKYQKIFLTEIAPAMIVAFAVDAVFCIVIGIGTCSLYHLMRGVGVSLPVSYSLYRLLLERR